MGEKTKVKIFVLPPIPPENRAVHGIMWKHFVEADMPLVAV
jgi:hypothetical protein